jgi:hypothetical protein
VRKTKIMCELEPLCVSASLYHNVLRAGQRKRKWRKRRRGRRGGRGGREEERENFHADTRIETMSEFKSNEIRDEKSERGVFRSQTSARISPI